MTTKLSQIANKAGKEPEFVFTSLAHLMDVNFLKASFKKLRKKAAKGVDGVSYEDYEKNLKANLQSLHERLKSKKYRVPNVKRVWISKGEKGKKRPLGISTIEDKIVQRAVSELLKTVFEEDFYDFSYGFRPNLSQHAALKYLRDNCMRLGIKYVIDADIQGCFDNFDHKLMKNILKQRVNDSSLTWLIKRWLKVGIVDGNSFHHNEVGTPQGNILSPLLCNIFLHYVLDKWIVETIKPLLKGKIFIVRYADDFVIGLENAEDARRLYEVLPKRMKKYGLTIHPDKSKMAEFSPKSKSSTLDFLGFTHYWTKSRKGSWVIKRKTKRKSSTRIMKSIYDTCRQNRHMKIQVQHIKLCQKLRGIYQYFAVRCNSKFLASVFRQARLSWFKWLNRRSQRKSYTWEGFKSILKIFPLPVPRIIHQNV